MTCDLHDPGITPRWFRRSPGQQGGRRFRLTIADLGTFAVNDYARFLQDWCRATLDAYGAPREA